MLKKAPPPALLGRRDQKHLQLRIGEYDGTDVPSIAHDATARLLQARADSLAFLRRLLSERGDTAGSTWP